MPTTPEAAAMEATAEPAVEAAGYAVAKTTGVGETYTMIEAATHAVAEAPSHAMPKAGMDKTYAAIAETAGDAMVEIVPAEAP